MSELSQMLKNRREEQKKTLAEVSADTKIRIPFLESIENGDFKALPSYLHAYGFVKKYAEYLGFPYEEIKDLFSAECPKDPKAEACAEDAAPIEEKKGAAGKVLVLLCVLAVVCAAGFFGYSKLSGPDTTFVADSVTHGEAAPSAAVPAQSPEQAETPVMPEPVTDTAPDNTPAPVMQESMAPALDPVSGQAEADNTAQGAQTPADNTTVSAAMPLGVTGDAAQKPAADTSVKYVTLTFTGDCWVLFVSDTGGTEDFLASAGTVKRLPFIKDFTIDIGNAAAISMKYDTQNFTNFGREGLALKGLNYSLTDGALVRVRNR